MNKACYIVNGKTYLQSFKISVEDLNKVKEKTGNAFILEDMEMINQ